MAVNRFNILTTATLPHKKVKTELFLTCSETIGFQLFSYKCCGIFCQIFSHFFLILKEREQKDLFALLFFKLIYKFYKFYDFCLWEILFYSIEINLSWTLLRYLAKKSLFTEFLCIVCEIYTQMIKMNYFNHLIF